MVTEDNCVHDSVTNLNGLMPQVLSDTVSKSLLLTGGDEAKQTANFVDMFNKCFDCLNVYNYTAGQ